MSDNKIIIVLVGETGSGKSFIMREILAKYPNIEIITKYTTRKSRDDEKNIKDVKGNMDIKTITSLKYTYQNLTNHELYGFNKDEIDIALAQNKIPCLDLSNENIYKKLLEDYPNQILIFNIIPYLTEETMLETFKKGKRTNEEYEQRKKVLENPITSWAENSSNVRQIINPFFLKTIPNEISKDTIIKRIENIIYNECYIDLGNHYSLSSHNELYSYLYYYSKNRPFDKELTFKKETTNHL